MEFKFASLSISCNLCLSAFFGKRDRNMTALFSLS